MMKIFLMALGLAMKSSFVRAQLAGTCDGDGTKAKCQDNITGDRFNDCPNQCTTDGDSCIPKNCCTHTSLFEVLPSVTSVNIDLDSASTGTQRVFSLGG